MKLIRRLTKQKKTISSSSVALQCKKRYLPRTDDDKSSQKRRTGLQSTILDAAEIKNLAIDMKWVRRLTKQQKT